MIYLYREPLAQEYVIVGSDPAEGGDYSAWVAWSKRKKDVLMVGLSKSESPQLGHELNHVGKYLYQKTGHWPLIAVERNTGVATLYVLKQLNYPNLYRMPESFVSFQGEDIQEKYGWTTNISTRPKMLDDLAQAIRQRTIVIPSRHIVDQLASFVRNAKSGKPEADKGCNDDLVIALSIALQAAQGIASNEPIDPYEFDRFMEQSQVDIERVRRM